MAIEVPVRKEIASFESRPAFGMTARQLVCFGVAIPLAIGSYLLFMNLLSSNAASTITILIILPIFAFGLFKKDGYTLEKYIRIVWAHRFTPQKVVYKTENATALYMSKEEWENDLAKKMLAYTDAKTSAARETNITYHLTQKQEKIIMLAAKKECAAEGNQYRKLCRAQDKRQRAAARHAGKNGGMSYKAILPVRVKHPIGPTIIVDPENEFSPPNEQHTEKNGGMSGLKEGRNA